MNNSSIITADRATHVKIVVVALFASLAVMIVAISARPQADVAGLQVVKAGHSLLATTGQTTSVR
jgi:hypothetical protein